MNFSLKKRISASFILGNVMILIIGFTVVYFLDSLNKQTGKIHNYIFENNYNQIRDQIRISGVQMIRMEGKFLRSKATKEDLENFQDLCDGLLENLEKLHSFYNIVEVKNKISEMIGYVKSLRSNVSKLSLVNVRDNATLSTIGELIDHTLEVFAQIQDDQILQNGLRLKQIQSMINKTKENMLYALIVTFLICIILSLIIPGKIALPFKKINDAVRELQDCNFDVSIYYNADDEIGEMANELNKMIGNMKTFEELRTDRVSVERRKFDILANMIKKNVLLVNANGELIYLNNIMYKTLNIQSEDILNKNMKDIIFPESIKSAFELALKRRSKIENSEIQITEKMKTEELNEETNEVVEVEHEEEVFSGYANIIPIRAKESHLDYYMMILSEEMFS